MENNIKSLDELLTDISGLHIIVFDEYARKNSEAIHQHFETPANDGKLYEALDKYAIKYARTEYDYMQKGLMSSQYAGHISKKDIFAYALAKVEFSKDERNTIIFDIDESIDSLFGRYDHTKLLPRLKYELLNPEKAIDYSDADVEHPAD